ncbi:MAG: hypothetical protein H7A46_07455 [Verrucomicrobiales bacterium]|nr:hypothetical protein [Verrucomicrobiales bacterium]
MNPASDVGLFFGRFHPLLLHLPIGFLVALAGLEVLAILPRFRQATEARRPILLMLVPAVVLTVVCGWLLSRGGGYDQDLVDFHFYTGIGVGVLSVALLWLQGRGRVLGYRLGLAATLGLMLVSSHKGGTLTHGRGYLTRHAPEPLRTWLGTGPVDPAAAAAGGEDAGPGVYAGYVRPILERNCVGCHGPEKAKGGLRCDSVEALLTGGDTGPVLVAGRAADSLLVQRIHLPLTDDEHMPPEGKPQPTVQEVAVLRWWIDTGASESASVSQLKPSPDVQALLDGLKP